MKIKEIDIRNFRGIEKINIDFSEKMNVFVGINGAGKTTILDALAISLSWLVNRIQRENATARHIPETSIRNNSPFSSIDISVIEQKKEFRWKLLKTAIGTPILEKSDLSEVSELASYFQQIYQKKDILPVIIYYPINRSVNINTISFEIISRENINNLDVYENALGDKSKTNFQTFFKWFKSQEDIKNERAQSRTIWIKQKKYWIINRTKKLVEYIKKIGGIDREDNERFKMKLKRFEKVDFIFDEPRFLFHEIIDLLNSVEFNNRKNFEIEHTLHDIEFLLHKMSSLSNSNSDNIIDINRVPFSLIDKIFIQIRELKFKNELDDINKILLSFIWEALSFSIHLSLWWLTDSGRQELEKIFKVFNPLNNRGIELMNKSNEFNKEINNTIINDIKRIDKANFNEGIELKFVTKAIENFIDGYSNLRVKRTPSPHMLIDKEGETLNMDQLSEGEKNLIAMVGDIARRLSIANPNTKKPLEGEGIILIDEIDLHLHPAWQRLMIPQLRKTFPNCQFIITTHSPNVISGIKKDELFVLSNGNIQNISSNSYGQPVDSILFDFFNVDGLRTPDIDKKINLLKQLVIFNKFDTDKYNSILNDLENDLGSDDMDLNIIKAEVEIRKKGYEKNTKK